MISDRKELDKMLEAGTAILAQRSELRELPLYQIPDVLDDGTKEMVRNRWGVLAQIIIDSINNWETKELTSFLAGIECPDLVYECVGYALQRDYGVILEELLIEADNCGCFDRIIKYVDSNLQHKQILHTQFLLPFLEALERHSGENSYDSILYHYAMGVASCGGFIDVVKQLGIIDKEIKYNLIYYMRRFWLSCSIDNAIAQIDSFLVQNNIWAWRAALDYCESSLSYNKFLLEKHYVRIDNLVSKNSALSVFVIPLLVEYILQTEQEKEYHPQYSVIVEKLRLLVEKIPDGTLKFLQKIKFLESYPEDVTCIFKSILSTPAEDVTNTIRYLDDCFSFSLGKKSYREVLDDMFTFFSSNTYRADYDRFFEALSSTVAGLFQYSSEITDLAIKYITHPNLDDLFFGLGLLLELGNLEGLYSDKLAEDPAYHGSYDDWELIRIMKAVLYFSYDDKSICHIAFMLLNFAKGMPKNYLQFCVDEVFDDYPLRMNEFSQKYLQSDKYIQRKLAEAVNEKYKSRQAFLEPSRGIPDLYPSYEHQEIYSHAQVEQSRQIRKRADEKSVFSKLFSRQVLKYGRRSAHVMKDSGGNHFYQSSPYHEFQVEHHFSLTYVTDPIAYYMRRYDFQREVEEDASNN